MALREDTTHVVAMVWDSGAPATIVAETNGIDAAFDALIEAGLQWSRRVGVGATKPANIAQIAVFDKYSPRRLGLLTIVDRKRIAVPEGF